MAARSPLPLLPLLLLLLLGRNYAAGLELKMSHTCEKISIEICQGIGYDKTMKSGYLPDFQDQKEAQIKLNSFSPLIQYKCSSSLRFFLCSVYTPMCDSKWPKPIGPCRPLCERVYRRCFPVLKQFGFEWPAPLNCSRFFAASIPGQDVCVSGPAEGTKEDPGTGGAGGGGGRGDACRLGCHASDMFNESDKRLAEVWMGILAGLCCLSSLATILTFLLDRSRFRYPVRPVMMMALCYFCYSLAYFVRIFAGRDAAACETDALTGRRLLTSSGLDNTYCAIVFLLQYFFSTAASAWYAVLVLTWLLQTGWKWSPEAVARRSCYFHLPAWASAIGLTVCVLIARRVEADELFGMCGVGAGADSRTLLLFVVLPQLLFLLLELVFLVTGFVAMFRVRRHVRSDGQKTKKFDVLMCKIGLFSGMYLLPACCVFGVNAYEYAYRDLWRLPASPYRPSMSLLLIRVFASLVIGVTTVLWIWSCKTVESWRSCLLPGRRPPGNKAAADFRVRMQPPTDWAGKQQQLQQQQQLTASQCKQNSAFL